MVLCHQFCVKMLLNLSQPTFVVATSEEEGTGWKTAPRNRGGCVVSTVNVFCVQQWKCWTATMSDCLPEDATQRETSYRYTVQTTAVMTNLSTEFFGCIAVYTASQKNVPPLVCYNFDTCERILIFFWQNCYRWSKQWKDALLCHLK